MPESSTHIDSYEQLQKRLAELEAENKSLNDRLDKYQHAINGANDGLWDVDLLTDEYFVNPSWLSMLGYSIDGSPPLKGLWESHLHPDDKQATVIAFGKLLKGEIQKYNQVFRLRKTNGEYIWVRSKASAVSDTQGRIIRVSGVHTDITEQVTSQQALIESEKKYKTLFENSLVAMFRSNIDTGDVITYNQMFLTLFGITNANQCNTLELYHNPEDRQWVVDELTQKGEIKNRHIQIKRKDTNEIKWVSFSSSISPIENTIEAVLIDIDEQIKLKNELIDKEHIYRTLFENSLMGIVRERIDTGEILEANDKFWHIVGDVEKSKQFVTDYYVNKDDRTRLQQARTGDRIEGFEMQIKRVSDNKLIWVLLSTRLRLGENIAESVIVDITKSKEDTIELQKVNFELDSFVYHSSHDLRSPLRSVLGLINIYRKEPDDVLKDEYIDRIEHSIIKLDHLVKELLSISRNDRINDPHQELNFLNEIDNSLEGYYYALDTDNLSIEIQVKQPVKFYSDVTRVRIILNNIISNAIKYRDLNKELSKVQIYVNVDEESATLKIIDNGEGIPQDQIPMIFDMFHRASDHSEGSGLGLYIVKNVIGKLNGQIYVSSKIGEETVFMITIPNSKLSE